MSAPPEDVPRPLQEHLIELLERLRKALIALGVGSAAISAVPASLVSTHPEFDLHNYTPFVMAVINRMRDDLLSMTNSFAKSMAPVLGIPEAAGPALDDLAAVGDVLDHAGVQGSGMSRSAAVASGQPVGRVVPATG